MGKKINITHFAVGDANGAGYQPGPEAIALKHEVWRGGVTTYEVDTESPNLIRVRTLLPSSVGSFMIRELGVFDSGGNLIAIGNTPDTPKLTMADGVSSEMELTMELLVSNTETLQCIVDPTVIIATKADVEKLEVGLKQLDEKKATVVHEHVKTDITDFPESLPANGGTADAVPWTGITDKPSSYPPDEHTHNYAGSSTPGGAAVSAVQLQTARTINGVAFNGTADISISAPANGGTSAACTGNAASASGLTFAVSQTVPGVVNNRVTFVWG